MKTLTLSIACLLALATLSATARADDGPKLGIVGYRQVCDGYGHCHTEPIYGPIAAPAALPFASSGSVYDDNPHWPWAASVGVMLTADFKQMPAACGPTIVQAPPVQLALASSRFACRHPAAANAAHETAGALKKLLTLPFRAVRHARGDCGCHGQCGAGCHCHR